MQEDINELYKTLKDNESSILNNIEDLRMQKLKIEEALINSSNLLLKTEGALEALDFILKKEENSTDKNLGLANN